MHTCNYKCKFTFPCYHTRITYIHKYKHEYMKVNDVCILRTLLGHVIYIYLTRKQITSCILYIIKSNLYNVYV